VRFYASILAMCLFSITILSGQSTLGEIRGVIKDPSGAAIGVAEVKATRPSNGEVRKVTTGESGPYVLANLEAGTWEVLIEKAGFRSAQSKGIVLRAREVARVDINLEVGQVSKEVQIVACQ